MNSQIKNIKTLPSGKRNSHVYFTSKINIYTYPFADDCVFKNEVQKDSSCKNSKTIWNKLIQKLEKIKEES